MRTLAHLSIAASLALVPIAASAQAPLASIAAASLKCKPTGKKLSQEGFVKANGIDVWVTIHGNDCRNPVILFVHGGPGNPLTPYANLPYKAWEKDFTIVHWDQRGAGRTFARNPVDPESPEGVLTIETMAKDGNELAAWLVRQLKVKKLILFGGSWGSALSVHMARARPDLYSAYLGTGQLVNGQENERAGYRKVLALARAAGDARTAIALEALGEPPWTNPRNPGIVRRAGRIYEAKTAAVPPASWWDRAPEYLTEKMRTEYENGEDYSWLQYVGMKGKGMLSTLDLPKLGTDFKMPVYLVQGADDLVTVPDIARRYFDSITAPDKDFVLLPATGHDPNVAMVEAQYKILTTLIAPKRK